MLVFGVLISREKTVISISFSVISNLCDGMSKGVRNPFALKDNNLPVAVFLSPRDSMLRSE